MTLYEEQPEVPVPAVPKSKLKTQRSGLCHEWSKTLAQSAWESDLTLNYTFMDVLSCNRLKPNSNFCLLLPLCSLLRCFCPYLPFCSIHLIHFYFLTTLLGAFNCVWQHILLVLLSSLRIPCEHNWIVIKKKKVCGNRVVFHNTST